MSARDSLPPIHEVMRRIDRCKSLPNKMYMRAEYLFCARGIELAGQLTSTDRKRHTESYGPIGKDVFLTEITPPPIPVDRMIDIMIALFDNREKAMSMVEEMRQKIKVAVFTVKVAKQHLEKGEAYPYRLVALPVDRKYCPWTQEMVDYYNDAGDHLVFDFNRQDNWEYVTRKDPVFAGLVYPIKKYHFVRGQYIPTEKSNLEACLGHKRLFKCHAIRHARADELLQYRGFDGYDMAAFVGWSVGASKGVSAAPAQSFNYANLKEAYNRYAWKMCTLFDYVAFKGGN